MKCPICDGDVKECECDFYLIVDAWERLSKDAKEESVPKRYELRARIASEQHAALVLANSLSPREASLDYDDLRAIAVRETDLLLAELDKEKA